MPIKYFFKVRNRPHSINHSLWGKDGIPENFRDASCYFNSIQQAQGVHYHVETSINWLSRAGLDNCLV